ncbi:ATP cone domain-containing protein (plasmid) [Entomospira entomophila]|uniref:Uncharacterized protein n=1 Tax=Entomospira entomophila TaxID=2719988 RepID=A0A968GAE5_9SPIO|nr:ATP cone domain-containing protein [Entomospira entomophilus]NIZ41457.1 hypothetical protein [Entomospira entomophilus]WDI36291.1 ATP cone domain-containing protein [Entomospira entomophilus]
MLRRVLKRSGEEELYERKKIYDTIEFLLREEHYIVHKSLYCDWIVADIEMQLRYILTPEPISTYQIRYVMEETLVNWGLYYGVFQLQHEIKELQLENSSLESYPLKESQKSEELYYLWKETFFHMEERLYQSIHSQLRLQTILLEHVPEHVQRYDLFILPKLWRERCYYSYGQLFILLLLEEIHRRHTMDGFERYRIRQALEKRLDQERRFGYQLYYNLTDNQLLYWLVEDYMENLERYERLSAQIHRQAKELFWQQLQEAFGNYLLFLERLPDHHQERLWMILEMESDGFDHDWMSAWVQSYQALTPRFSVLQFIKMDAEAITQFLLSPESVAFIDYLRYVIEQRHRVIFVLNADSYQRWLEQIQVKEESGYQLVAQVLNLPQIYQDGQNQDFFVSLRRQIQHQIISMQQIQGESYFLRFIGLAEVVDCLIGKELIDRKELFSQYSQEIMQTIRKELAEDAWASEHLALVASYNHFLAHRYWDHDAYMQEYHRDRLAPARYSFGFYHPYIQDWKEYSLYQKEMLVYVDEQAICQLPIGSEGWQPQDFLEMLHYIEELGFHFLYLQGV